MLLHFMAYLDSSPQDESNGTKIVIFRPTVQKLGRVEVFHFASPDTLFFRLFL
jgi:hypothetical protein